MAPSSRAALRLLSLLWLSRVALCSEHFSSLALFNNQLKQGCSSLSEWEEYAAECGKVSLSALAPVNKR